MPVLRLEVVEVDREEHVVVDRVAARPTCLLCLVERRMPQPGAALDQAHIEGHLVTTHAWLRNRHPHRWADAINRSVDPRPQSDASRARGPDFRSQDCLTLCLL